MKKVLLIAYFFPPAGAVGVYRTLKFAKYLPEFGWQPVVLTASNGKYPKYDPSLLDMVPEGVEVHRCRSFEALNEGYNRDNADAQDRPRTLWSRLHTRFYLMWHAVALPDTRVGWVPSALFKAWRLVRSEKIDTVYISGSPFSSFLIGPLLKTLAGVRVVVDYRDPWTQNIKYGSRNRLLRWIDHKLEAWVVSRSDVVVANTRVNRENMIGEFGRNGRPGERFVAIHNGFDAEEFAVPRQEGDRFTVTYAGAFYYNVDSSSSDDDDIMKTYSPLYFFDALEKFFARRPEAKSSFRVNFMGVLGHGYDPVIREKGLDEVVNRIGYIDYDEHIAVLKNSDALLLVLSRGPESRGWIPSKFYQYLGSGNPILALVPAGEVRDIIERAGAGVCVEPDDVDGASAAIEKMFDAHAAGRLRGDRDEEEVGKYERKYLTSLLAKSLDAA